MPEPTMTATPTTAPTTTIQPTAPATEAAPAERPNLNQRAAAIVEQLQSRPDGTPADPAPETSAHETSPPDAQNQSVSAAGSAGAPDRAKNAADRQARMDRLRAKERSEHQQRAQSQQQTQAQRESAAEVERLRSRLKDLEPLNNVFADEAALLSAAEKKGLTADKLIAWMRQRISDPSAVAERQAKTVEEKLAAQIAEQNKKIDELQAKQEAEKKQAEAQQEAQHRAISFLDQAEKATATHPLSAALLKRHGPKGLIAFANTFIAPLLGEEHELQDLHDHMEQFLDEIQVGASPSTDPSKAPSHAKKNGAAEQPGMTLSNSLTSERATVTEQVPLHRLSLKERERLLIEQLERE